MSVGLPFGIGAKIAKPDKQVIVVQGEMRASRCLPRACLESASRPATLSS